MSRLRVGARIDATVVAAPMHGEVKVRSEGWRTRDAHLLQWLEHDFPDMVVVSRPEPFPRLTLARRRHDLGSPATWVSPEPFAPSAVWSGKRWWVNSKKWLPDLSDQGVLLAWNPLAAAHYRSASPGRRLVFDFLDDWLIHPLFAPIRSAVNQAHEAIADHAVVIFCNSEATFARAEALGRSDALLMPNGCDPEIFSVESSAAGDRTVLGYAGKLGSRLDTDLILEVANALPSLRLVFAGPVLERAIADRI